MKRVIVVGTSHRYQIPTKDGALEFSTYLKRICARYRVCGIAEELSLEGLGQFSVAESVCHQVATERKIAHRYCDPDNAERAKLGIVDQQKIQLQGFFASWPREQIEREVSASHAIRERYWADELDRLDRWPTLFVCGANHVDRLKALLVSQGKSAAIARRDWAPENTP